MLLLEPVWVGEHARWRQAHLWGLAACAQLPVPHQPAVWPQQVARLLHLTLISLMQITTLPASQGWSEQGTIHKVLRTVCDAYSGLVSKC